MSGSFNRSLLCIGILTVSAASLPAQHPDPRALTGTWKMDTTKFAKHDRELVSLTLNVAQHGDTLLIVTDGRDVTGPPFTMTNRYIAEGAPSAQAMDSVSHLGRVTWAGDTMVVRLIEKRPQRTLDIEEHWLMLSDGQTLSRFQSVRDGARLSRQTLIFSRVTP
jgi:hypothetical protein